MGRFGAAGDNAAMESFFSLLQYNVLNRRQRATRNELRIATVAWIEHTHHHRRHQPRLARLTPIEHKTIMKPAADQAAQPLSPDPAADPQRDDVHTHMTQALDLLENCTQLYATAPSYLKKLLNTVFFHHLDINHADEPDTDQPTRSVVRTLHDPFHTIASPAFRQAAQAHENAPEDKASGANDKHHFDDVSIKSIMVALQDWDTKKIRLIQAWTSPEAASAMAANPATSRQARAIRHTRLTKADAAEALAQYQRGTPVKEICSAFGISRHTLGKLRRDASLPQRRKLTTKQIADAIGSYRTGASLAVLGQQYGVSPTTMRHHLSLNGVTIRRGRRQGH